MKVGDRLRKRRYLNGSVLEADAIIVDLSVEHRWCGPHAGNPGAYVTDIITTWEMQLGGGAVLRWRETT